MILTSIDYAAIFLYVVLVIYVGTRFRGKISSDTFLISNRNLGFFSSFMTISASKVGAGLLLTYSALVFAYGLSAMWLFAGYVIGYFIFYFFAAKLKIEADDNGYYTLSDYFRKRFGSTAAYLMAILVTLSMFGWILTNLIGGSKIISLVSGISFPISLSFMGFIILIYLFIGGFASVVRTDVLQNISIFAIFSLILFIILTGRADQALQISQHSMPIGDIITFILAGILFPLGSAELWQRVYATRSIEDIKKSLISASIFYFILGAILSIISLKILTLSIDTGSEVALVEGLAYLLPQGFGGLLIVAFFAAIMSSADTFIFTTSSSISQDFIQKIFQLNNEKVVGVMKPMMILIVILAIAIALLLRSVVDVTFLFASVTLSIGIISLFSWVRRKLSPISISIAVIGNLIIIVFILVTDGISIRLITFGILSTFSFLLIGELISKIKTKNLPNSGLN